MTRRAVIALLAIAVVVGGGYGVLRWYGMAPGLGPLTDPGSQRSDAGFSGGSGSVPVGTFTTWPFELVNFSRVSGTVDSISVDHATPGLRLLTAYIVDRKERCTDAERVFLRSGAAHESSCLHPVSGFVIPPRSGGYQTPPHIDVNRLAWRVVLVFRITQPGIYSFRGIDVHYHLGPLHYTSTYKRGLTVCAPERPTCPYRAA